MLDGLDGRATWFEEELAGWLRERPRFERFAAAHRDKIRKKLRTTVDEESVADVRAELLVAYRLLADRRFELAFEASAGAAAGAAAGGRSGAAAPHPHSPPPHASPAVRSRRAGPDLTASFRTNQSFGVEVTRLRAAGGVGATGTSTAEGDVARLARVLLGKVRQLPAGMPNVVALVSEAGAGPDDGAVAAAVRQLKTLADRKAETVFTRRGFESARDFYAHYVRLSGVAVVCDVEGASGSLWINPEARHALSREAAVAASRCLIGA